MFNVSLHFNDSTFQHVVCVGPNNFLLCNGYGNYDKVGLRLSNLIRYILFQDRCLYHCSTWINETKDKTRYQYTDGYCFKCCQWQCPLACGI